MRRRIRKERTWLEKNRGAFKAFPAEGVRFQYLDREFSSFGEAAVAFTVEGKRLEPPVKLHGVGGRKNMFLIHWKYAEGEGVRLADGRNVWEIWTGDPYFKTGKIGKLVAARGSEPEARLRAATMGKSPVARPEKTALRRDGGWTTPDDAVFRPDAV